MAAFAKNHLAIGFKIDYVKADGDLSNYFPSGGPVYRFAYVDEKGFMAHRPADFADLVGSFRD